MEGRGISEMMAWTLGFLVGVVWGLALTDIAVDLIEVCRHTRLK